jgi:undecaprenyl phosphate N,N'-diacetylbacillosamine 1-phosphate transferase
MLYKFFFKRSIDFIGAGLALMLLSPVFITILVVLFFANNGKPFFYQMRPGKNSVLFKIVKFKTMNDRKDTQGNLLPDALRLNRMGSFVRKTSLDEIPQLWNVLKGEMSLIGPRPLLIQYLELYNDFQKKRHQIRPGITGWAQVNGRNAISWQQKFEYDVWYVENCTFVLDCKIVITTLKKVFKSEGISARDSVTIEEFKGN